MEKFHDAVKTIYGPKSSEATSLLSADGGTLFTVKNTILKRWAEHFNSVLNRPSSINEGAIDRLPQIECNDPLDEFPTVIETRKADQQLSSGKRQVQMQFLQTFIRPGPTYSRETDRVVSVFVEEGGYPTRMQSVLRPNWYVEILQRGFEGVFVAFLLATLRALFLM